MPNALPIARLLLLAAAPCAVASTQSPLDADRLFDPTHLVQVEIELPAADWDALRRQSRPFAAALGKTPAASPFTYFEARVTIDGVAVDGVGVRKKGFIGSLSVDRPSLKVKFGEFGGASPARGFDRLTLNNNLQDKSLLSQHLTYRAFRASGLAAPRCNFARVTVNGDDLGVYCNVESIKPPFLERVFGDGSGELWEGTVADLFVDSLARFEPKTASAEDRTPLVELATALDRDTLDLDEIGGLLDVDAFLGYWATETLLGYWDGYTNNQNNYFLYRSPKTARLTFIPWGADYALTERMPLPPYVVRTVAVHSQAVLPNRLFRLPSIQSRYRAVLESLLETVWDEAELLAEADRVTALVEQHLCPAQARVFEDAVTAHRAFIDGRRARIGRHLRRWPTKLRDGPRRPSYAVPFAEGSGTFATSWTVEDPAAVEADSAVALNLTIDGEEVEFTELSVHAKLGPEPGPDGRMPPTVWFRGERSGSETVFLVIGTAIEDFRPTEGAWVELGGVLVEGARAWLDPKAFRIVSGRVRFDSAAMTEGAAVRGELRIDIVQLRGGEPDGSGK